MHVWTPCIGPSPWTLFFNLSLAPSRCKKKKKNRKKEGEMKNKHYANKLNSIPQYYSFSDKLDEKA